MTPWKLPLIVAALAAPIVVGFLLVGPALGTAIGVLAVFVRSWSRRAIGPRGPIGAELEGEVHRVLLVAR